MLKSVERVMAAWAQNNHKRIGNLHCDNEHVYYHDTCLVAFDSDKVVLNRTVYSASTTRIQRNIEAWLRDPTNWRADFDESVMQAEGAFRLGVQPDELLTAPRVRVGNDFYRPPWPMSKPTEPPLNVSKSPSIYQYNPEVGF